MTQRIKLKLEEEIEMLYAQLDVKEAMIKNYTAEIETQRQQLAIAVRKLDIAKELLSAGKPMVYLALEHIEYALERIKALDEIKEIENVALDNKAK